MLVRVEFNRSPTFEMQNGNANGPRTLPRGIFPASRRPGVAVGDSASDDTRCDALIPFDFAGAVAIDGESRQLRISGFPLAFRSLFFYSFVTKDPPLSACLRSARAAGFQGPFFFC